MVLIKLPILPKVCSLPFMGMVFVSGVLNKKNQRFWRTILEVPAMFRFTKDFLKIDKGKYAVRQFLP
jgi:hypothetical protein